MSGTMISTASTGMDTEPQTVKQAIENSCNVALMQIGEMHRSGGLLPDISTLFGFGEYDRDRPAG